MNGLRNAWKMNGAPRSGHDSHLDCKLLWEDPPGCGWCQRITSYSGWDKKVMKEVFPFASWKGALVHLFFGVIFSMLIFFSKVTFPWNNLCSSKQNWMWAYEDSCVRHFMSQLSQFFHLFLKFLLFLIIFLSTTS